MTFDDIITVVLDNEGGEKYVNDPSDPGGETKYGVSKRSNPDVDIKNLTKSQAIEIYRRNYWKPSKAEKLPDLIRLDFFDGVVNLGLRRMTKILQKCANARLPSGRKIAVDGFIGPQTIEASKKVTYSRLRAYKTLYYAWIVKDNPKMERYYYGWYRRANHVSG